MYNNIQGEYTLKAKGLEITHMSTCKWMHCDIVNEILSSNKNEWTEVHIKIGMNLIN